jgi:hypothetical protein
MVAGMGWNTFAFVAASFTLMKKSKRFSIIIKICQFFELRLVANV